jgi:ferritin-like metal-binding protein YciE
MEDETLIREYDGSEALDAGLIAYCQAIGRYQIARYGALKSWAIQLGWNEVAMLLDQTLREKKNADASMSGLAASEILPKAA